jgi:hypothetical protein
MGTTGSTIIWGGFAASVLAACAFWLFRSFEWTRFSPTAVLGCIFRDDPRIPLTETVGLVLFMAAGSTLVPALYAWVMDAWGGAGWRTGLAVGALNGALVVAALPLLGRGLRCVRAGRLPPPGPLGLAWGRATPLAVVVGHLVYGGILGGILGAV